MTAVLNPSSTNPKAARRPAPPAPTTTAPKLRCFVCELVAIHGVQVEGLDADGERDFLFFFQLLFGFCHFTASILDIAHSTVGFLWSLGSLSSGLLLFLLCLHHGLSLLFCLFQAFSLFFSLFGLFVGFFLS